MTYMERMVIRRGHPKHIIVGIVGFLREYVRIASSGRQHFPLPVGAPLPDFEAVAGRYPVYRIDLS